MEKRPDNPERASGPAPAGDDCRDYNPADYKDLDDRRFLYARREALFAQLLCLVSVILEFAVAYGLCPKDSAQMIYILGFPVWFVGATCVALLSYLVMLVYCLKFSRDFSLSARDTREEGVE